jgi:hypothetical protein
MSISLPTRLLMKSPFNRRLALLYEGESGVGDERMNRDTQKDDYAIPIEGLVISRGFSIGPVAIYKSGSDLPFANEVNWTGPFESKLVPADGSIRAVACVHALSAEDAISITEQALEICRVFHYGLMRVAHYTHFGLSGEITSRHIFYIRHTEEGSASGFTSSGLHLGFELVDSGIDSWEQNAHSLQLAAGAVGNPEAPEGATRALRGVRYFSRSILTREPDLRVLLVIAGIEAMLSAEGEARGHLLLRDI